MNTEFSEIEIWFTDQNNNSLEIEDNVNISLIINTSYLRSYKMRYSLEPSYRRYVQRQGFMSFAKNIGNKYGRKTFDKSIDVGKSMKKKYGKKILDNSISAGKDLKKLKIAGKKVLTKSADTTGDMIGNKIADRITKSARNKEQKEDDRIMEETQELIIPPE